MSRHLDTELALSDWDVMILHYLGLDHIGHLAGPKSPLVKPKLREMDQVVENIHRSLMQQVRRDNMHLSHLTLGFLNYSTCNSGIW